MNIFISMTNISHFFYTKPLDCLGCSGIASYRQCIPGEYTGHTGHAHRGKLSFLMFNSNTLGISMCSDPGQVRKFPVQRLGSGFHWAIWFLLPPKTGCKPSCDLASAEK